MIENKNIKGGQAKVVREKKEKVLLKKIQTKKLLTINKQIVTNKQEGYESKAIILPPGFRPRYVVACFMLGYKLLLSKHGHQHSFKFIEV